MTDAWGDLVWAAISNLNARLALVMPGILAMLTLAAVGLAGGWITARIVRRLARALAIDRRADEWGVTMALGRSGLRRAPSEVIGLVVFWSIFIVFVTLGVEALAIPGTGRVTDFVLAGLPKDQVTVRECPDSYHVATLDNDAQAIFEGSVKFVQDHAGEPAG